MHYVKREHKTVHIKSSAFDRATLKSMSLIEWNIESQCNGTLLAVKYWMCNIEKCINEIRNTWKKMGLVHLDCQQIRTIGHLALANQIIC